MWIPDVATGHTRTTSMRNPRLGRIKASRHFFYVRQSMHAAGSPSRQGYLGTSSMQGYLDTSSSQVYLGTSSRQVYLGTSSRQGYLGTSPRQGYLGTYYVLTCKKSGQDFVSERCEDDDNDGLR